MKNKQILSVLLPEGEGRRRRVLWTAKRWMRGPRQYIPSFVSLYRMPLTRPSGTLSLGEREIVVGAAS